MKNIILIIVVIIIAFIALKSLYKMLTGKGGCSCSKDKKGSCNSKNCKH